MELLKSVVLLLTFLSGVTFPQIITSKIDSLAKKVVIETLKELGCTDIKIDGLDSSNVVPMGTCWSMVLPNGTKWAGGFGAVRLMIERKCKPLRMTRRDVLRLSHDVNGKQWAVSNGG